MKAVVTGAAGFAGYSLVDALLKKNNEVYAILRPGSEHNKRFKPDTAGLHLIELDCADFDKIADFVQTDCEVFYHLAWFGGRDDFEVQKKNIDYCLMALESAGKLNCKRFVGIGSQAEYGVTQGIQSESLMPNPVNSYGSAKTAAMYLSKRRAGQLDIEWIWGRIFSLYGDFEPSGRMLPDLMRGLKNNEDFCLSSCRQNWDYLHVKDAAEAIIAIGTHGLSGEIYNIANGDYRPLKEFVEEVKLISDSDSTISYGRDPEPFIALQPDVSKIKRDTGWAPIIDFSTGVKDFLNDI